MLTAEDKYQYWLTYATNDYETAQAMFDTGRWGYVFITCQQALEKLVKGLHILYVDDNVPRIHDIPVVFSKFASKLKEPLPEEYLRLFERVSDFYRRSSYPDYARELEKLATKNTAETVFNKTKEAWQWLLTMKPQTESSDNTSAK